jgi:hypothetical protein
MKIENQVCTPEQGEKLKELGVWQESLFYWTHSEKWGIMYWTSIDFRGGPTSVFTAGELAAMIGKGTNAASLLYDAVQSQMNRSHSFTICYSPEFLANVIISMLQTGRLTAEEINERLKEK